MTDEKLATRDVRVLLAAMDPEFDRLLTSVTNTAYRCGQWTSTDPTYSERHAAAQAAIAALMEYVGALLAAARHGAGETEEMERKAALYDRINTPEVDDFLSAVRNEALHQRERWSVEHDGGKEAADWFWLVGYLAGKALHDVKGKRLHHIITAAAALLNWHGKETGHYAAMRPGIADPAAARAAHPEGPQHETR